MCLISRASSCLALALLLAGCGQKGPLYLPDDKAAAERYGIPEQAQNSAENSAEDTQQEEATDPPEKQATEGTAIDNERGS